MIRPHLFYQTHLSFLKQNDGTSPTYGELSEYTYSAQIGDSTRERGTSSFAATTCRLGLSDLPGQQRVKNAIEQDMTIQFPLLIADWILTTYLTLAI